MCENRGSRSAAGVADVRRDQARTVNLEVDVFKRMVAFTIAGLFAVSALAAQVLEQGAEGPAHACPMMSGDQGTGMGMGMGMGMMGAGGGMMGAEGMSGMGMMQGQGMHGGAMGMSTVGRILGMTDELDLAPAQVQRLEALRESTMGEADAHMQAAMEAHRAAQALLEADAPDIKGYEETLRDAAGQRVLALVARAEVRIQAFDVLTPEQRAVARETLAGWCAMMGGMQTAGQASRMSMPGPSM